MFRARSASRRFAVIALLLGSALAAAPAPAQQARVGAGVPWPNDVVGTLRSFFERVDVDSLMAGVTAPPEPAEPESPAMVAGRLPDTVQAPFRYVQGATGHRAYPGSLLGAGGVLLAGGGNSLDRALLLRELYAARGLETRLVRGRLRWADAVRLVGSEPADLDPGNPWLRRVEIASDHWWVELRQRDGWLALDPSFTDTGWGESRGRARSTHERVPSDLVAGVRLEIVGSTGPVARADLPLAELIGRPFEVTSVRESPAPEADPLAQLGEGDETAAEGAEVGASDRDAERPDDLTRFLQDRARPVGLVRVAAGGGRLDVPLRGVTGELVITLELAAPFARPERIVIPFDPAREDTIAVVLHAGEAASRLAGAGRPLYRTFDRLARAETVALQAWVDRPRTEDDEGAGRDQGLAPSGAADSRNTVSDPAGIDVDLHPARALQLAALRAWREFGDTAPRALGFAMLAAADRLRSAVPSQGQPVRLVAVRWTPPGPGRAGALAVWSRDPTEPIVFDPTRARGVRSAAGFLHSALLGQVLHSVADAAPVTAFDLTLRSVGLGQRLAWWQAQDRLPDDWPESARRMAEGDRDEGRLLVGPPESVGFADVSLYGWWAVDGPTGATRGRVVRRGEVAEAAVDVADALDDHSLGSVLASLPALQHASHWLVGAAAPSTGLLAGLVPRACAATALVGDLLTAGAPPGFVVPMFAPYCAGAGPASPSPVGQAPAIAR